MSGSCKHQKRCGLLLLRLLYIFLNKIYKKKKKKKKKKIVGYRSWIFQYLIYQLFTKLIDIYIKRKGGKTPP